MIVDPKNKVAKVGHRQSKTDIDDWMKAKIIFLSGGKSGRDGSRAGAASFVSVHEKSSQRMLLVCEFHN